MAQSPKNLRYRKGKYRIRSPNKKIKLYPNFWPTLYQLIPRKTGLTQYRILLLKMSIYVIVCIKCTAMWLESVFPAISPRFVYWTNFKDISSFFLFSSWGYFGFSYWIHEFGTKCIKSFISFLPVFVEILWSASLTRGRIFFYIFSGPRIAISDK